MIASRRTGFTLIELLIVVAIVAIMSAASMAILVGPMQVQALSSMHHSAQAGATTALARMVDDAHQSASLAPAPGTTGTLVMQSLVPGQPAILYYVDANRNLRRVQTTTDAFGAATQANAGAALLNDVQTFTADSTTTPGLTEVHLRAASSRYQKEVIVDHRLLLAAAGPRTSETATTTTIPGAAL